MAIHLFNALLKPNIIQVIYQSFNNAFGINLKLLT